MEDSFIKIKKVGMEIVVANFKILSWHLPAD
jgi:hypothetical protein